MYEDPEESPTERSADPAVRAQEQADKFRTIAELAAVFEGARKFEAQLKPGVDAAIMRDLQRAMATLEKSKLPESPVLPEPSLPDAAALLDWPATKTLSTNDYHIHRRPGEVMIARWLAGPQVDQFYKRLQAHFDAAIAGFKEDERQALEWKQDESVAKYLEALDKIDDKLAEQYLRDPIRAFNLAVLSTQTADEINIQFLCETMIGVPIGALVGPQSVPPDEPSESDLAWFFKLFSLRGVAGEEERICIFVYMQKSDDSF